MRLRRLPSRRRWLGWNERLCRVSQLAEVRLLRAGLDALTLRLDGRPAAAETVRRKRAVLHNALEYAVELGLLEANPLARINWTAPKVADTVDRRVVVNPAQARQLLAATTYVGRASGRRLTAFFACM